MSLEKSNDKILDQFRDGMFYELQDPNLPLTLEQQATDVEPTKTATNGGLHGNWHIVNGNQLKTQYTSQNLNRWYYRLP